MDVVFARELVSEATPERRVDVEVSARSGSWRTQHNRQNQMRMSSRMRNTAGKRAKRPRAIWMTVLALMSLVELGSRNTDAGPGDVADGRRIIGGEQGVV